MDQAADRSAEAVPLDGIIVRPVRHEERARWRQLMQTHHYLGLKSIVGQSLWYVALFQEQWVALLGWGAAALKCAPRDTWIGWSSALRFRRLHLLANNARFLVLSEWRRRNVASRVLALNCKRLSQDWERYHGHPILLAETFVDPTRFRGTCYLAAGWLPLGQTLGFAKRGRGYVAHGQPKLVLVRPLCREARQRLLASFLPPSHSSRKENPFMLDVNRLPLEGEGGLIEMLRTVVDPRKPQGVGQGPLARYLAALGLLALDRSFRTHDPARLAEAGCRRSRRPDRSLAVAALPPGRCGRERGWENPAPRPRREPKAPPLAQRHPAPGRDRGGAARGGGENQRNPRIAPLARTPPLGRDGRHRRCVAHPGGHRPLSGRGEEGRLSFYGQRQSTHPQARHRRSASGILSPLTTPPAIKATAAWKSAASGPAPNSAATSIFRTWLRCSSSSGLSSG